MDEHRQRSPWFKWAAGGLITMLAYPLSMGPALWMMNQGYFSENFIAGTLGPFFLPIEWLIVHRVQPAASILEWYLSFWN